MFCCLDLLVMCTGLQYSGSMRTIRLDQLPVVPMTHQLCASFEVLLVRAIRYLSTTRTSLLAETVIPPSRKCGFSRVSFFHGLGWQWLAM